MAEPSFEGGDGGDRRTSELLLGCGVVGPLLFVLVFMVEGLTRPGYDASRNYVSQLSLGEQGWIQQANFVVFGVLMLCFAAGLRGSIHPSAGSTAGPILLGIFGLALIVAGVFNTDPSLGYPPGAPDGPAPSPTPHGIVHALAGLVAFVSLPAACFALARRFAGDPDWEGWAMYSIVTGVLMLAFFVASEAAGARFDSLASMAGLLQRVSILVGWAWVALLALRLLREARATA